jgi:hypothetical protein
MTRNRQPAFTARLKAISPPSNVLSRLEYLRRYPSSNYERYLRTEAMLANYYAAPQEVISANLKAEYEYNKARGWSTE